MRVRFTLAASLAATALFVPFAGTANAVTTTSTTIFYAADPNGDDTYELYSMPADGSADGTLFAAPGAGGDLQNPVLSPDGTKVAYLDFDIDDTYNYQIKVRAADGSGSPTTVYAGDAFTIAWSPDGTTIAFSEIVFGATTVTFNVLTVPAAGGSATMVASNADNPSFSPSGDQLVVDNTSGTSSYLEMVALTGHARAKIAGTDGGSEGVFSPDGQTIAFTKWVSGCQADLLSVPVTGAPATTLNKAANHAASSPEFSDDGAQIFWTDMTDCTSSDVYVAAPDGSAVSVVRSTTADESYSTVAGGTVPALETTAPAAPVVTGSFTPTSATLSWTESSTDVAAYSVVSRSHGDTAPTGPEGSPVTARSKTLTGLTSGTTYDLYVFAIDASGNVSPATLHSVTPSGNPVVTQIGTVAFYSYNTTFTLKWTGNAAAYRVLQGERHKSSTGTWLSVAYATIVNSTTAKSKTITGTQGHSYAYKVIALDSYGNTGGSSSTWADEPFNENYSALGYSAGWTSVASGPRWMASYRYTTSASRTITLTSETERFQIIGDRCVACGAFRVYIDGVLKATIDTGTGATMTRQLLYTSGVYSGGPKLHTLKIVTLGTAGRPRVAIDAIGLLRR